MFNKLFYFLFLISGICSCNLLTPNTTYIYSGEIITDTLVVIDIDTFVLTIPHSHIDMGYMYCMEADTFSTVIRDSIIIEIFNNE